MSDDVYTATIHTADETPNPNGLLVGNHHRFFLCRGCRRPTGGCLPSCKAPAHAIEYVDSCAVCVHD